MKEYKLSELADIIGGGTPKTSRSDYWGGDIPWLSVVDFNNDFRHVFTTEKTITEAGLNNSSTRILYPGEIIISARGTVGALAQVAKEMAFNQSCYGLRAKPGITCNDYLFYLLRHSIETIKKNTHGSVFDTITRDTFESISVILPDLKTQQKVASILTAFDDKIELNAQINHNLEEQAKAIFKSWFVDFEPFNGKMPKSWLAKTLADVSKIGAGGDKPHCVSEIQTPEFQYPIYSNGLANDGLYGYASSAKIYEESITVSARGTIGFVCLRQEPYVPIVRLITLIPNTCFVSAKYLYLYLKGINISGTGTTQQQLTVPDFQKTSIMVPDNDTMKRFTICADSIFEQIKHNAKEMRTLAQLRDTLLPKLMSGEIDVSEVEV